MDFCVTCLYFWVNFVALVKDHRKCHFWYPPRLHFWGVFGDFGGTKNGTSSVLQSMKVVGFIGVTKNITHTDKCTLQAIAIKPEISAASNVLLHGLTKCLFMCWRCQRSSPFSLSMNWTCLPQAAIESQFPGYRNLGEGRRSPDFFWHHCFFGVFGFLHFAVTSVDW